MSQLEERIKHLVGIHVELTMTMAQNLAPIIAAASKKIVQCLLNEGKILVCGQGGSAANALHFTTAFMNHFDVERPSLPAISLSMDTGLITGLMADHQQDSIFAKQIQAIANNQDILLLLTTSGQNDALIHAVNAANDRGIDIITLSGGDGGVLTNHLGPEDIEIRVQADTPAQIRELHLFILHSFCDLVDQSLFGQLMG